MNQVFVIADTHFGHKRVLEFEPEKRPFSTIEEHDEALVARWNAVVSKKDTVIHLGDVCFGRKSFEILPRLNGIKKLIAGNHDHYATSLYLEHFNRVSASEEYKDYILTHIPVHVCQFTRYKGNIHGHLHSRVVDDPRYKSVSVEHTNLAPLPLSEVLISFSPPPQYL